MPITASLDPEKRCFRTTISGTVTIDEMVQHIANVRSAKAYRYPGLIDARQVETLSFGRRDLTSFLHDIKDLLGTGHPAPRAVVVKNVAHVGLARLVASQLNGWMRIGVFEDISSAEEWLNGLDSSETESDRASLGRGD